MQTMVSAFRCSLKLTRMFWNCILFEAQSVFVPRVFLEQLRIVAKSFNCFKHLISIADKLDIFTT